MGLNTKTLLVGCGGSGIKTLIHLNKLMASNGDIRETMAESVAYLVLDTNKDDLSDFQEKIQAQMGRSTSPVVETIHITDCCTQLNDIVSETFDSFNDKVTDLMKKYWWYSADGNPFRAEEIQDITAGAGQCPQISYLAAWNSMDRIEDRVNALFQRLHLRDTNTIKGADVRVFVVAGLAGGTGRGSWTLVAFKVRECLLKLKLEEARIEGIFFDASCFGNITKGDSNQARCMNLNACTGMSELAAWFRLRKSTSEKKFFFLPSLRPTKSRINGAISFDGFKTRDINRVPPVQGAYVVFGQTGGSAPLKLEEDDDKYRGHYFNMAAAALYARIVNAGAINAVKNNMKSLIGGFASTTFEIDTFRIQAYLETQVQKTFLNDLWIVSEEAQGDLEEEARKLVGTAVDKSAFDTSFLGKTHLQIPDRLTFGASGCMDDATSLPGTLMALFRNGKKAGLGQVPAEEGSPRMESNLTNTLRDALARQHVRDASDCVAKLSLEELKDADIAKDFGTVLKAAKLDSANLKGTLRDYVMEQVGGKGESLSLRRAMLYTEELLATFSKYRECLTQEAVPVPGFDNPGCPSAESLINKFQADVIAKSGTTLPEKIKGAIFWAAPFNPGEIEELCDEFECFVNAAVFFRIRPFLADFFKDAVEALAGIRDSLELMGTLVTEAGRKLEESLSGVFSQPYEKIFDELFVDPGKPGAVRKDIPDFEKVEKLYCRRLKPILSPDELTALLRDPRNRFALGDPIKDAIREELDNLLKIGDGGKYSTREKARRAIPGIIKDEVVANVGLKVEAGRSVTDREFSFDKVLERNIEAWNKLLAETPDALSGTLFDQFREFLGLETSSKTSDYLTDEAGKPKVVTTEKAIEKAILSLTKICQPWINIRAKGDSQPLSCLIVLPFDLATYGVDEKQLVSELKKDFGSRKYSLMPIILQHTDKHTPPDRILVYTSELLGYGSDVTDPNAGNSDADDADRDRDAAPIDRIASMDYWEDYADELLEAEDLDHNCTALFYKDRIDGCWKEREEVGVAFLAPFFTLESEPHRALRWCPWRPKDEVDRAQEQVNDVCRALFYALLGHAVDEAKLAPAREALEEYEFRMPLLKMARELSEDEKEAFKPNPKHPQFFYFLRKQQEVEDSKMSDSDSAWDVGKLANSINHVFEFLNGQGLPGDRTESEKEKSRSNGDKIRQGLLDEAELFGAFLLPKLGDRYRAVVEQCRDWIEREYKNCKEPEDKKYWELLFEFAKSVVKEVKGRR